MLTFHINHETRYQTTTFTSRLFSYSIKPTELYSSLYDQDNGNYEDNNDHIDYNIDNNDNDYNNNQDNKQLLDEG